MGFKERYEGVLAEIEACCAACGRDPSEVRVVAVSKTVGVEEVGRAAETGHVDFGENRPDQILEKQAALPELTWHFIGNIQSRRVKDIVRTSSLIHSVCEPRHLTRINAAAIGVGKVQEVLLEVNVSGEESKSGFSPDAVRGALVTAAGLKNVTVRGLMTMAPQGDPAAARECFEGLAKLAGELRAELPEDQAALFNELSMGMSEDWREAVCAGATMLRIGRALFDEEFEDASSRG